MTNFQEFLTEARMAPLYHSTNLNYAVKILNMDELQGSSSFKGERHGVSTTRDLIFALYWNQNSVVFELDQQKLSQRYKIVPFNFFKAIDPNAPARHPPEITRGLSKGKNWNVANQFEEVVVGNIKPLDKYIKKIIITDSTYKYYSDDSNKRTLFNHPLLWNYDAKKWINK